MTFGIFTIIVLSAYIFYFTLMLTMDASKFKNLVLTSPSGKQNFVVPQVEVPTVKVTLKNTGDDNFPELETSPDDERPEDLHEKKEEPTAAGSNLFEALGIETITEEEIIEVDGEALNFMLF